MCLRCGFIWADAIRRTKCAHCVNYRTGFDRIISPYRYDFPIDGIIQRLKYQNHLPSARLLGCLLAREVTSELEVQDYPDVLLPVPMHVTRYRQRGFNHAAEIAHWCGRTVGIDSYPQFIERRFDTGSLAGFSRSERDLQIRGAFKVADNVPCLTSHANRLTSHANRLTSLQGLTVAIVDDVLTTGATAGELATELLDNGVKNAQLWTVARTPATGTAGGS